MVLNHSQTQNYVTNLDQTASYPDEPKNIINLYNQPVISSSITIQNPNYIYCTESQLYILYRIPAIYILYRIPTIYTVQRLARNLTIQFQPCPEVIKLFSSSTQPSMQFQQLIKTKMKMKIKTFLAFQPADVYTCKC